MPSAGAREQQQDAQSERERQRPGRRMARPSSAPNAAPRHDRFVLTAPATEHTVTHRDQHRGQQRQRCGAVATTEKIIPSAIERNTMMGTTKIAASDSTTVNADRNTALPAVVSVASCPPLRLCRRRAPPDSERR